MNKTKINTYTLVFILILLAFSALGYLLAPEKMLSMVGISGTKENSFLVKTLAAALLSFIPSVMATVRNTDGLDLKRQVVFGLALYMFVGSAVDLFGYLTSVVNSTSVPSIAFRIILGIILLITNERKK